MLAHRLKTSSWAEALEFYEGLVTRSALPFMPMVVGRVPNFAHHDNTLEIELQGAGQSFVFTYWQRPDETTPWSRTSAAAEGRASFERLLHKRLRWFHEG